MKDSDVFELQRDNVLRVEGIKDTCVFSSLAVDGRADRIAVVVHPKKGEPYLQLVNTSMVKMAGLLGKKTA